MRSGQSRRAPRHDRLDVTASPPIPPQAGVLPVSSAGSAWQGVSARLRPFIARRVESSHVDDILQDVLLRIHHGLAGLRDEERFTSWLFRIARSAVAEHLRARARHPVMDRSEDGELAADPAGDDRDAARALACCISTFVARLPSPYREAVTLVELEGMTVRAAAEMSGISVSGMKSRVQRGRAELRRVFEDCCVIALDARGKVIDYARPPRRCRSCE
jgi:RNA polymerase sigma-70 factor, ECF subfamily